LKIPKAESSNRIFLLLRKPLDQFKRNFEEETLFFHRPIKLNIWARKILFGSKRPSELSNWQLNTTNLTEFELLKSTWGIYIVLIPAYFGWELFFNNVNGIAH
jgi:hypothetical protein